MKHKIKIFFTKLKKFCGLFAVELHDPYYHGMGGQLAFYLFMSILPLVTLLSQLLSLFSLSLPTIEEWASLAMTNAGLKSMEALLADSSGGTISGNILLVLVTIWAASRAQFQMTNIADYIYNDGKDNGLNFIKRRSRSYILIIIMILTLSLTLAFLVYLPRILTMIFGHGVIAEYAGLLLSKIRWLIVLALYFMIISVIYFVAPSHRIKFKEVLPGSIFASIGFILVTLIYNIYIKLGTSRNIIYGSLSNVVALMMWFFFISWVICLGAVSNKLWKLTNEIYFPKQS